MTDRGRHEIDRLCEEATDWMLRIRVGAFDHTAYDAWLRASPAHIRAYLEMSVVWESTARLNLVYPATTDELIARAREDENIVALDPSGSHVRHPESEEPSLSSQLFLRKQFRWVALSGVAFLTICLSCGLFLLSNHVRTIATALGEQRSVTLIDGSTIDLDTRTRIKVHFSARERTVDLLEGQALFRVARNVKQPFVVKANGTAVRDVGTEFDVYLKHTGLVVTVLEGRVAVTSGRAERVDLVSAGEQLRVDPMGIAFPSRANTAASVAWTQHRLIFESTPLTEVVDEFNRYNKRQLIIDDPRLYTLQISGVFSSYAPAPLINFLTLQPEIATHETQDQVRIALR